MRSLCDDYYAADGALSALDAIFVDAYGKIGAEALALSISRDIPPIFAIAPGPFEGDEENSSGDCLQYNTPYARLRLISNEPYGYISGEIEYLIDVPNQSKKFWVKCTRSTGAILPDITCIGAYENVTDFHALANEMLYDLFVIAVAAP